jgi:CubicO group peptidase (beta-lactamase class C family)
MIQHFDTIIVEAIKRRVFPGAVVLIKNDAGIAHFAAYGSTMYDAPGSQSVALDTIYDIASLTKVFTATAALRLIDQGALDLYAPVRRYLHNVRSPDITIHHLLTHTSGLDIRLSALRHLKRVDLLAAVYNTEPLYPPGTKVAYTNVNSLLLGEIVSQLCAQPLDAALMSLVIEPLGLRDTQFRPRPELLSRIAPTEIDAQWRNGLVHGHVHDESAYALGGIAGHAGLFSTAEDLLAFCRVWLWGDERRTTNDERPINDRRTTNRCRVEPPCSPNDTRHKTQHATSPFLSPETMRLACTNHTPELSLACGLGWMMDRPNFMGRAPQGSFGHTGFTGPAIVIIPQHRLIVIVLNNRIYPQRGPSHHHAVIAAIVETAIGWESGRAGGRKSG